MYYLKILIFCLVYATGVGAQNTSTETDRPRLETLYRVDGVFHHSNPRISSAVVIYHLKERKQHLYWVGDLLDGGLARLTRAEADGAYVYYYGDYYFMPVMRYSDATAPSIVRRSSRSRGEIADIQHSGRNDSSRLHSAIGRLKGLAGLRGNAIQKEAEGLRVGDLKPDSMLYRAGLRNGDLIQTYNSKKIRVDLKVTTLVRAMKLKGHGLKLGILRDGRSVELDVKKVSLPKVLDKKK
ncbi:MAG: hypothetical protein QF473_01600 [Planctomycetota bacterium]|nr:hypothetical protein [Planctomycetota bacterium]